MNISARANWGPSLRSAHVRLSAKPPIDTRTCPQSHLQTSPPSALEIIYKISK